MTFDDENDQAIEELESDVEEGEEQEEVSEEIDALAREMGWSPADEWRGDPEKHVDARTFIKTGPEILKSTLRKQDEKLDEVAATMKGMAKAAKGAEDRAYARATEVLKAQQEEAVADGDVEEFKRIGTEIDELDKPDAQANNVDPNYSSFQDANPWYGTDYERSAYADQIAPHVGQKFQGVDFYKELSSAVAKKFPDTNPNRDRAPSVEGGGGTNRPKAGGITYKSLPAEAKAACDDFVTDGIMTREEYVTDYFSEGAA
jgi:hypothetical protein